MKVHAFTRRAVSGALALGLLATPLVAGSQPRAGRIAVDVSDLRRQGDNTDADFISGFLPGYLAHVLGPGHSVVAHITSVTYGPPGSSGNASGNRAVDTIEGVGVVDGRNIPVQSSIQAQVLMPDPTGWGARVRQQLLAQSFAEWLSREAKY